MGDGFFSFMNRLGDLVILNLIFLITCIPIITIGPALAALYSVTLKMTQEREGYVFKNYFHAFKSNFKQAALVGIPLEILTALLIADTRILLHSDASYASFGLFTTIIALTFLCMVFVYAFPLMARYENKLTTTLMNSVLLSISKLPYTVGLIGLLLIPILLIVYSFYFAVYILVIGCSLCAYLQSKLLIKVFSRVDKKNS